MNALPQSVRVACGVFLILLILAGTVWFLARCLRKSVDATALIVRWITTAFVLGLGGYLAHDFTKDDSAGGQILAVLLGAVFGLVLAILWVPALVEKVSEAIGGLYTGGNLAPTPTPAYSVAEARRKQGLHREALYEILKQLEKFPEDVTGQMMLAEIQAENLRDLEAAEVTIERFVAQDHAPRNIAFALNSLADWRLKLARDPDAARRALERIIELLPDTEEAQNASQRIAHLATPEELRRREQAAPVAMPVGQRDIGLRTDVHLAVKGAETADETLGRLSSHLAEHPLDRDAREQLALLYADEFHQVDLAIEQFEQLAQLPNQSPRDIAKWIHRIADFQVVQGAGEDTIRATLQRIIDQFPGLAPAEIAQQRLEKIRLEIKGKEKPHLVSMGSYEKDLGLKGPGHGTRPGGDASKA